MGGVHPVRNALKFAHLQIKRNSPSETSSQNIPSTSGLHPAATASAMTRVLPLLFNLMMTRNPIG
jgi:hypothetical protein